MASTAESVRRYAPFFRKKEALKVLDYGTGTMRNALFLARSGFRVIAADLPQQIDKLRGCSVPAGVERLLAVDELGKARLRVDLVLSTYVFNIIMDRDGRKRYLATAAASLRPGGYLLMEVRCRRPGRECGTGCDDFAACDGCPKALSHEELDDWLRPHGLQRISHYYRKYALAAIYMKQLQTDGI